MKSENLLSEIHSNSPSLLCMPEILDMKYANQLYGDIRNLLTHNPASIELECSQVKRITTPCIQILLVTSRDLESEGHKLRILSPSKELKDDFKEFGLMDILTSWSK